MARSSASLASILADRSAARFVISVSGTVDGVDIRHDIFLSTVPVQACDVAAFVYLAVTGKRLSLRRWDWSLSTGSDRVTHFNLCGADGKVTDRVRYTMRRCDPVDAPAPVVTVDGVTSGPTGEDWAPVTDDMRFFAQDATDPRGEDRAAFAFGATRAEAIDNLRAKLPSVPAPLAVEPVAPADVVADAACAAFDATFYQAMRDSRCFPVREIRRKAMFAAVAAGALLLASMGAQAGERATFLHNAARACGVATAIAAPSYDREYDRQWGSNTARHFAGMATAQRADICREVLRTISKEGARLGVTRACDTDTDCERKNGRL